MTTGTEEYYAERAAEYDQVYDKPERQADLAVLRDLVAGALAGRSVLDVAAGTGYWTERYADATRSTVVSDVNDETLEVARGRRVWPDHVRFVHADAFALDEIDGRFDAAFAGFLWSHIDRRELGRFLDGLVRRLEPGSVVVLIDNRYVEGSNHPINRTDEHGNTYQERRLEDGRTWEVRKNFPTPEELTAALEPHGHDVSIAETTHFWAATFRT